MAAGRLSRWYAAALVVGLLYLVSWLVMAGFGGSVVQVDFNAWPELEGAVVFVDGDSVGTLFRRGRQRLSGFRVGLGRHTVTVRHDTLPSDTSASTPSSGAPSTWSTPTPTAAVPTTDTAAW